MLNNPLAAIDPTGLDCVYLNDAGDGPESVDHSSNPGECGDNGGAWLEGTIQEGSVGTNPDTGQVWGTNSNGFTVTNDPAQSVTVDGDAPVGEIRSLSVLECAASFAPSLAKTARIQGDTFPSKVGENLLGNTFSGIYDTYKAFTRANGTLAAFGSLAVNGLRQGLPGGGPLSQGLSGTAQDKALKLAFQNLGMEKLGGATVKTAAATVGDIKIGYDLLTFGYTAYQCAFHKF